MVEETRHKQIHTSTVCLQHDHLLFLQCYPKADLPNVSCTIQGNYMSVMHSRFICGHVEDWPIRNEELLETEALSGF